MTSASPMDADFEASLMAHANEHRQHKYGRHSYTFEDFGLNRDCSKRTIRGITAAPTTCKRYTPKRDLLQRIKSRDYLKGGDDVFAHQFDGLHHIVVGYVVGVEQAEDDITTRGFVGTEHLDRPIWIPAHASVGVEQIVHGQVTD